MGPLGEVQVTAVVLRVRDVAAAVRWWRDVLDVEPLMVGADGSHPVASLLVGGVVVSLWQLPSGVERDPAENDRNTGITFAVADDPAEIRERLVARGVDAGEVQRSRNFDFFWFHDLDSNRFEVSRLHEGAAWDAIPDDLGC